MIPRLRGSDVLLLTTPPQANRWINFSALKHYFNVYNKYVLNKLILVVFPWRHKP